MWHIAAKVNTACAPFVSSVLLHLCRHVSVPRQVSSDLFCSKDTDFSGFTLCDAAKDVCSCNIILGLPYRRDHSDKIIEKQAYDRNAA